MNKIAIIAHPQSGYEEVEDLLHACGMAAALPSRRENFTPQQISATLFQVHTPPPQGRLHEPNEILQISVGPVWHGLALDLMLGNLEQPLWGWSDPRAICLLDYWRDLDPAITFVLAYDKPHSVLTRATAHEALSLSPEALTQRFHAWTAYNTTLLHFFRSNPERCLLVHTQQARNSGNTFLQELRTRIAAPWRDPSKQPTCSGTTPRPSTDTAQEQGSCVLPAHPMALLRVPGISTPLSESAADTEALVTYLADALVREAPSTMALYGELQAAATLPLVSDAATTTPLHAWRVMVSQQQRLAEQSHAADSRKSHIESLSARLRQEEAAKARAEQLAQTQKTEFEQTQQTLAKAQHELQRENENLLDQLHQVQEELERYLLENQQLKTGGTSPKPHPILATAASGTAKPSIKLHYGAAQRIQQQLSYKLGAIMIEYSKSPIGWIRMPWALARVSIQHRRAKPQRDALKLPPIHRYADAHQADRYRNHLSYRLGQTLLTHVKNPIGWMKLPGALLREIKSFQQSRTVH